MIIKNICKKQNSREISKLLFTLVFIIFLYRPLPIYTQSNNDNEPINLTILNTENDEFAPSYNQFQNFLYFNRIKNGYSFFYSSGVIDNYRFAPPLLRADDININQNNQAYIIFLDQDQAVYSTYSLKKSRSYMNLFSAYYKKGKWTNPIILDSLCGEYFVSHPTISPDGNFMIFSSDRSPEDSDTDLWIAFKQDNGTWGEASPLSELNSPGNEITPFLKSNDSLFFSSNALGGPGGYDIYLTIKKDGLWTRPYPMNEINTKFDESDICVLPNKDIIFSSDRPGTKGGLDLYSYSPKTINNDSENEKSPLEISAATTVYNIKSLTQITIDYALNCNYLLAVTTPIMKSFYDLIKPENKNSVQYRSLINLLSSSNMITLAYNFDDDKLRILKDSLVNYYYRVSSKKNLTFKTQNTADLNNYIYIICEDKKQIFELENISNSIDPNKLEITLNSRPEELFLSGKYFYKDESKKVLLGNINNSNSILNISLDTLLNSSFNEFKIITQVLDKKRKEQNADLEFIVSNKTDKSINSYTFDNRQYNKLEIIPFLPNGLDTYSDSLKELFGDCTNIIIEYPDQSIEMANQIKSFLTEKLSIKSITLKSKLTTETISIYF